MENQHYPFKLMPLPYAYDALEPYIDEETMHLHHDKHLKTYVDNLNAAIEKYPEYHNWDIEKFLTNLNWLPPDIRTAVRHNAGGVYNHEFYFANIAPGGGNFPENLKKNFKEAALGVFGSGYAWVVEDGMAGFRIIKTQNQDTPLELNLKPVACIDVWEHAYYLKNHNLRSDYIENWLKVVRFPA